MSKNKYVIVIVNNGELTKLPSNNASIPMPMSYTKYDVFSVGQQMLGIRWRDTRPTHVIIACNPLTTEKERRWYEECLAPIIDRAGVVVIGKERLFPEKPTKTVAVIDEFSGREIERLENISDEELADLYRNLNEFCAVVEIAGGERPYSE